MTIDKSWTLLHKNSDGFWNGLQAFLLRCRDHLNFENKCRCPCNRCNNVEWGTINSLQAHIHSYGFSRAYKTWIHHGEPYAVPARVQHIPSLPAVMGPSRCQRSLSSNTAQEGVPNPLTEVQIMEELLCPRRGFNRGQGKNVRKLAHYHSSSSLTPGTSKTVGRMYTQAEVDEMMATQRRSNSRLNSKINRIVEGLAGHHIKIE